MIAKETCGAQSFVHTFVQSADETLPRHAGGQIATSATAKRQDSKNAQAAHTGVAKAFKHDRAKENGKDYGGRMADLRGMRHVCVGHATHTSKKKTQRHKSMRHRAQKHAWSCKRARGMRL